MIALVVISSNVSNIVLMPRFGPKPLVPLGMLLGAAGMAWLTRIGVHSTYAADVLPPLLIVGAALGMVIAPSINTGTFGVAPEDAGVASASVNTGQQLGGSIGTSLLNTVAASATAAYLTAHLSPRTVVGGKPSSLADHAGAGARVHHGVLVGSCDLRVRGDRGGGAVPPGPAVPPGAARPGGRRGPEFGRAGRGPGLITGGTTPG